MALTIEKFITSSWINITGSLPLLGAPEQGLWAFEMEQTRESNVAVLRFGADVGQADIEPGTEIRVMVDGDQWFGGYVTTREQMRSGAAGLVYGANYQCQDYNSLLDRIVVAPTYTIDQGDTDSTEIETLRSTYLAGEGVTAGDIQTVEASMPADLELLGTFRECMEQIAAAAGGAVFYINADKELNYAAAGGDFTWASTNNLSDDLTVANSFPYGEFVERSDETRRITDVYIVGDGIEGWYPSPASGLYYQAVVNDPTITTQAGLDALGAAIVDDFGSPLEEYRLKCWEDSFWTYGEVRVRHSDFITAGGEVLFVRRSVCRARSDDAEEREFILELGDHTVESDYLGPAPGQGAGGGMSNHNLLSEPYHADTTDHTPARGDIIVANSDPTWDGLAHPASANRYIQANANDPSWVANLTMDDDAWIGAGAGAGRLTFNSSATPDIIWVGNANFDLNGNDLIIDADGDSYLHSPSDDVVDIVLATASGELGININGAEDFTITANRINVLSGSAITMADDTWIGIGASAGRWIFDATPAPDAIILGNANLDINGQDLIIDTDGDSYLHASGDDVVDLVLAGASGEFALNINGAEDFRFIANSFYVLEGSAAYVSEYVYHLGDTDTFIRYQADQITLAAGGADLMYLVESTTDYVAVPSTSLYVGPTTANTFMSRGITIDQGSADNEVVAVKSSDVAHGMITHTDTNTYGFMSKTEGASGGLMITGAKDADGGNYSAMRLRGFLGEAPQTSKGVASYGVVSAGAWEKDGTGVKALAATGANVFSVDNAGSTRFIIDREGDIHVDAGSGDGTAGTVDTGDDGVDGYYTFDEFDDAQLVRALDVALYPDRVIRGEFDAFLEYGRADLERANIASFNDDGHHFVNVTQLQRLHNGAIWQLYQRCQMYERALIELGADPALLEGGNENHHDSTG